MSHDGQNKSATGNRRLVKSRLACLLLSAFCLLTSTACRRDMQDQPKMKPFRASSFFADGLSARQPVEGTIPRGFLRTDTALFTGKKNKNLTNIGGPAADTSSGTLAQAGTTPSGPNAYPDDVETFPFPVTADTVKRGRERYDIFCSVCHGKTGRGDGMIVRRGFRRAASFHDDRLRAAPVGHFFDAVTNGWGAMPSYAPQIPVQDRWAIIAYIRALQASQNIAPPTPGASPAPAATPAAGGHQ
jgi:mono/diheme cytochrome c family protein